MKHPRYTMPRESAPGRPFVEVTGTRFPTALAAKRSTSPSWRRCHNARVFSLPGGGFDIFPAGHPIPTGAEVAE